MPQITPIYERGHQPHVFERLLRFRPVHVEEIRHKPAGSSYRHWIDECKPLPWDRGIVAGILEGEVDDREIEIRPRRPRSWRLLWRAAQAALQNDLRRAHQLANTAMEIASGDYDLAIIDVIRGFELDMLGGYEHTAVVQTWREQADWWSGGQWTAGGRLGGWLEQISMPLVSEVMQQRNRRQVQ